MLRRIQEYTTRKKKQRERERVAPKDSSGRYRIIIQDILNPLKKFHTPFKIPKKKKKKKGHKLQENIDLESGMTS